LWQYHWNLNILSVTERLVLTVGSHSVELSSNLIKTPSWQVQIPCHHRSNNALAICWLIFVSSSLIELDTPNYRLIWTVHAQVKKVYVCFMEIFYIGVFVWVQIICCHKLYLWCHIIFGTRFDFGRFLD
jgi:hypothetical protein